MMFKHVKGSTTLLLGSFTSLHDIAIDRKCLIRAYSSHALSRRWAQARVAASRAWHRARPLGSSWAATSSRSSRGAAAPSSTAHTTRACRRPRPPLVRGPHLLCAGVLQVRPRHCLTSC